MNAALKHDRYYVGGANIAGILGISPFSTPRGEYHKIMGDMPEINEETMRFFKRRKALESYVAQVLTDDAKMTLIAQNVRYTHPLYYFMRAEIDAENDADQNVEIKTITPYAAHQWGDSEQGAPAYVTAQTMYGLGIRPKDSAKIAGMIGFDEMRLYDVPSDVELIDMTIAAANDFWNNHILKGVPPAPTTVADVLSFVKPVDGKEMPLDGSPKLVEAFKRLLDARANLKSAEKAKEAEETIIKLAMGEATILTFNGKQLISWKEQITNRVDVTGLKTARPEIYEAFLKPSTSRVFRVSEKAII